MGSYFSSVNDNSAFAPAPFYVVRKTEPARLFLYFPPSEMDQMMALIKDSIELRAVDATNQCVWALQHLPRQNGKLFERYQVSVNGVFALQISFSTVDIEACNVCQFGVRTCR